MSGAPCVDTGPSRQHTSQPHCHLAACIVMHLRRWLPPPPVAPPRNAGRCDDEGEDFETGLRGTLCEANEGTGFRPHPALTLGGGWVRSLSLATGFVWFHVVPWVQVSWAFWVDAGHVNVSLSASHRIGSFSLCIPSPSPTPPFPLPSAQGGLSYFWGSGFASSDLQVPRQSLRLPQQIWPHPLLPQDLSIS